MKKYLVLAGQHLDTTTGKLHAKGDTVVTAVALDVIFPGKFADQGDASAKETKAAVKAAEPAPFASALGEDATAEFSDVPAGHAVVKKGSSFFVVEVANPDEALHEKALTTKQVASFLSKLGE